MYLNEESRNNLVAKSKRSEKGLQRYKRRVKSKVSSSTAEFNNIDMNTFFKQNILTVSIKVHGETDDYIVKVSFGGVLDNLKEELKRSELDLRIIVRSLINAFNKEDVYVNCSCPDFLYRYSFVSTKNKYNSGEPQTIPANITNPHDTLGSGCKHVLLVLSNTVWIIKVASVIKNYIEYLKRTKESLYAKFVYPALYGKEYEEPTQQQMWDDKLQSDEQEIDVANRTAREKGKFTKGNQYRFTPNDRLKDQIGIGDEENAE